MKTIYSILLLTMALNSWGSSLFLPPPNVEFESDSLFFIQGKVTDNDSNEPIIFGSIGVYHNGALLKGTQTDFDGNYTLIFPRNSELEEMIVDVVVTYLGYQTQRIVGMIVKYGKVNKLDIQISDDMDLDIIECIHYTIPIISPDDLNSGQTLDSYQIQQRANRRS